MQICHKEITVVYFHPLFASHAFTLLPSLHGSIQGRIQDFNKGGRGTKHCLFFLTAASLESRASPKKALISGGRGRGGLRPFFSERHQRRESRKSQTGGGGGGGGGGGDPTHFCVPKHFFYVSKGGGGHMYQKKGGGNCTKMFQGGHGQGLPPPPPKSATGSIHPCPNHNDDYCVENLMPWH